VLLGVVWERGKGGTGQNGGKERFMSISVRKELDGSTSRVECVWLYRLLDGLTLCLIYRNGLEGGHSMFTFFEPLRSLMEL
jgi:hypothetical protein